MLLTGLVGVVALLATVAILATVGRVGLTRAIDANERCAATIRDFYEDLVAYANSHGSDEGAFQRLALRSTAAEAALGWDNFVVGVNVGIYRLDNAPLFPLAIQEMRRAYNDGRGRLYRGGQIADVAETVLFRHLGRRDGRDARLRDRAGSLSSCVAAGWSTVIAIPISVLSGFGLLTNRKAERARKSFLFRLWSFALALAALVGPMFAYLADREKIDAAVRGLIEAPRANVSKAASPSSHLHANPRP